MPPIKIVEIQTKRHGGIVENLYGVEVLGEVRATFETRQIAEAFANEIVSGES